MEGIIFLQKAKMMEKSKDDGKKQK